MTPATAISANNAPASITAHEWAQIEHANASGRQPVVFIHGLWLLPGSWERWTRVFEAAGYVALSPGWPGDPDTTEEARRYSDGLAHKSIGQVTRHYREIIINLRRKPALIGHSFGGAFAQILAGEGLSAATVAISPAGFRGVFPVPFSALKSAWPVLGNPLNRTRAVPLTFEQFRYSFANTVGEAEARELFENYAVPGSGMPLFQAAVANLNPWTELRVDTRNPSRGPLLLVTGDKDNVVPPSVVRAAFTLQSANFNPTEFVEMPGRGHALTIDAGWQEIAETALKFIDRFATAKIIER